MTRTAPPCPPKVPAPATARWAAAVLALAGALAPRPAAAQAPDLAIDALAIQAGASLSLTVPYPTPQDPNHTLHVVHSGSRQGNTHAVQPPTVVTGTADDRWQLSYATASMANSGFFREAVSVVNDYPANATLSPPQRPLTVNGGADTSMSVTVRPLAPDAPLDLGLTVFGAHLAASDYYGLGRLTMTLDLVLQARFDNGPVFTPWSYHVDLLLNDSVGTGWTRRSGGLDLLGVGHPVEHLRDGPQGFSTQATLDIDFFHADLDFGLLQPGHSFTLSYLSAVSLNGELTYGGPESFARIDLTDPLTLGGDTRVGPITLAGLALPSPVPAPPGAALLLAGLAALGSVRLGQARQQRRPVGRQR